MTSTEATMPDERKPTNEHVHRALNRLVNLFKDNKLASKSAPRLSHYRELPEDIKTAYDILHQGVSLVHATSTKYTLVGKISIEDQKTLAADLLRGCELISAATHTFLQDGTGCSRALRQSCVKAILAILINVVYLVKSFEDNTAMEENIGAQRTGAVWESCDKILNKLLPQGNRNAIRRDLFTWTRECQDTMDEFQEMIDLGPTEIGAGNSVEEEEEDYFGEEDQYSEAEMPIAIACFAVLKCSRGTMKVTLDACEELGKKITKSPNDEKYLDSIAQLYESARIVGEGVTDYGSALYPPLAPNIRILEAQLRQQTQSIISLQDFLSDLDCLPSKVTTLANTLKNAAETRQKQAMKAILDAN